jgi:hypothetical protein
VPAVCQNRLKSAENYGLGLKDEKGKKSLKIKGKSGNKAGCEARIRTKIP